MAKYTYNWSGQTFEIDAPPGTTEATARAVFEQQLNTGGLTNLKSGESVNALSQLGKGLTSAASQVKGAIGSVLSKAQNVATQLVNGKVSKPMNIADFVNVGGAVGSIGPLDSKQVQGLLAQSAALTAQASSAISVDKGIGKFGINPDLLENSGFIKPGTISQYGKASTVTQADIDEAARINASGGSITPEQVARNTALNKALSSPTVWTGKLGINNLGSMLGDATKQLGAQAEIMKGQFANLSKSGVLPTNVNGAEAGALIQAAGKVGAALTAAWAKGGSPAGAVQDISNLAKSGQLAVNFTDLKVPASLAGERSAPKATNTVNRKVLDQAFTQFVGTAKVPTINYDTTAPTSSDTPAIVKTGVLDEAPASVRSEFARLNTEKQTLNNQIDQDELDYKRLRSEYGSSSAAPVIAARDKWEADLKRSREISDQLNRLVQQYPALLY